MINCCPVQFPLEYFVNTNFLKTKLKTVLFRRLGRRERSCGAMMLGGGVCFASLCKSAWAHLTFRVCTPSPQLSRMLTKVTLQMLHGSVTHKYWLQSLWQGTTSYTWNTHRSQWSHLRSLMRVSEKALHLKNRSNLILATFISLLHCWLF